MAMQLGERFDIKYETMPWHHCDSVVFDIGGILIYYAPDEFVKKTQDSGIVVKSLLITNHDFSNEYNKAIEAKKVAEQGALKAKYDLEKTRLDAEAQTLKQKSLNQMVLQEKFIDKWDGKLPMYMGNSGQMPFILK